MVGGQLRDVEEDLPRLATFLGPTPEHRNYNAVALVRSVAALIWWRMQVSPRKQQHLSFRKLTAPESTTCNHAETLQQDQVRRH